MGVVVRAQPDIRLMNEAFQERPRGRIVHHGELAAQALALGLRGHPRGKLRVELVPFPVEKLRIVRHALRLDAGAGIGGRQAGREEDEEQGRFHG